MLKTSSPYLISSQQNRTNRTFRHGRPNKTILILGATGGIGEAFAQRFHALGKKVIIAGRRGNKIEEIEKKLPGVEGYVIDNTKLNDIPGHIEKLFSQYPDIDTVWVNGGIQCYGNITKLQSNADQEGER